MRILSVSHYYPPHIGGLELVAQKQAQELSSHGHQVIVVTFASADEKVETKNEGGIKTYRIGAINFFDKYFGIPFPIGGINIIKTLWKEIGLADAVHIHDVFYSSSWIACLFAYLRKKPLFLTQHVGLVQHQNKIVMLIQRLVYAIIGKLIFRYSQKIIAYNDNVKKFLETQKVNLKKILELRNGIDVLFFHKASEKEKKEARQHFNLSLDRPIILFVGRLVFKKGFEIVLETYSDEYDIVIAGPGKVPEKWQNVAGVCFMGAMSQSELAKLYRAADIFVFPAQDEIFTLAMQEAMASGLPVITTNDSAYLKYEINHDLISFVEPSASKVKAEIEKIISEKQLYDKMSDYSLQLAHEWFDYKRNIKEIITLYNNLKTRPTVVVATSWDDGHILDLKLAELLKKYDIQGTFYVAPENCEMPKNDRLSDEQIVFLSKDFEIGAHTMTHKILTDLRIEEAQGEIQKSKEYLEKIINKPVLSFCYPRGAYFAEHANEVKKAGFNIGRTIKCFSFDSGTSPYELPTSIDTYDHWSDLWQIARFVRFNPVRFFNYYRKWDVLAMAMFDQVMQTGGIFHLWGHSWEIEKHQDWDRLEKVLAYISNKNNVSYVTNKELL